MKRNLQIDILSEDRCVLGESPIWSSEEQALYWVDIRGERIHRHGPEGAASWSCGNPVGAVALIGDGTVIATFYDGIFEVELGGWPASGAARRRLIAAPPLPAGARFKEGKVDSRGRYWFGSTGATREEKAGGLFRLDANGACEQLDGGFMLVNGIAFSPDGSRLIVTDTPADLVHRYDYDIDSGTIGERRTLFDSSGFPGFCDGATFDSEGGYWCAMIHDWTIARITPTGAVDRMVRLPVRHPTMAALGGAGLDTLYVTSSTSHLSDAERAAQPHAGKVFAIKGLGVTGLKEPAFGKRSAVSQ